MQKFVPALVLAAAMAITAPVVAAPVIGQAGLNAAVDSGVVQVADGCGRGWHRGPGGRCRPNGAVVCCAAGRGGSAGRRCTGTALVPPASYEPQLPLLRRSHKVAKID